LELAAGREDRENTGSNRSKGYQRGGGGETHKRGDWRKKNTSQRRPPKRFGSVVKCVKRRPTLREKPKEADRKPKKSDRNLGVREIGGQTKGSRGREGQEILGKKRKTSLSYLEDLQKKTRKKSGKEKA